MSEKKLERVPADVAQVMLLTKMLEVINQVAVDTAATKQLAQAQIPEGIVEPLTDITVTDQPVTVYPPLYLSGKFWFSIKIINDGPNNVYVLINTDKSPQPRIIRTGETWGIDFPTAQIRDMQLWCNNSGETAVLRITGVR